MKVKKSRRLFRIPLLLLLLALLSFFGVQFYKQEQVLQQQQAKLAEMQQQKDTLDDEYAALLEQAKDKGSLEYIERYMRERFGMVKDNEWIIKTEEDQD